ncbi:MAG: carboxylating nicotinate-nucleotide diphosphorylase [Deltaproteobacteria bacterium]|nr:carboxylating nicotinate-nucleotide diphosphorylase [Deltaproteobacteria bacterium]
MIPAILDHSEVDRLIQLALDEDGVANDLTTRATETDPNARKSTRATIVAKKPTVSSGYPVVEKILRLAGMQSTVKASTLVADGTTLTANSPWMIFEGRPSDLLRAERTLLNFLMRMCGIAYRTQEVVKTIEHTGCKLLHTRKTAPGHRRIDVYAALSGGAHPHRRALDEAILVKENHLRVTSSFQAMVDGINKLRAEAKFVEIEVTDFTELKYAMGAKPDRILLDNFSVTDVARAVNLFGSSVQLEASGTINLETAKSYAETGVDFISMGGITHSAPSADLSLLFDFGNT